MTPRLKIGIICTSMLLTGMLVIGALMGQSQSDPDSAYRPLAVYTDVLARIKAEYVEEPDMSEVTRGALHGLVEHLDPLSSYLTAEQYKTYLEKKKNPDGGTGLSTGLVIRKRGGYAQVLSVLPDSPAEKAGIETGDFIEAVDGLSTRALPPAYLYALLSGKPGTTVELVVRPIRHSDEPQQHTLARSEFRLPPVSHKIVEGGLGYIDAEVLHEEQVAQLREAIEELEAQGARGLILDLRSNASGDPENGVRAADLFIDEGRLASLKGQQVPEKSFQAKREITLAGLPVVVITDRATSQAAEVLAAAILDLNRGDVVGESTYGLASKQEAIEMDDGAALILSVAKYYRPNGKPVDEGGVEPSHPLSPRELRSYREELYGPMDEEGEPLQGPRPPVEAERDPYLQKAIKVLREQLPAVQEQKAA